MTEETKNDVHVNEQEQDKTVVDEAIPQTNESTTAAKSSSDELINALESKVELLLKKDEEQKKKQIETEKINKIAELEKKIEKLLQKQEADADVSHESRVDEMHITSTSSISQSSALNPNNFCFNMNKKEKTVLFKEMVDFLSLHYQNNNR